MFLTRLGEGSKAVVTGDVTQIDLASGQVLRARKSKENSERHLRHFFH